MHRILKRGALELLSGSAAPAWYQPILDILTSGGATGYLWLKDEGIATPVGDPVAEWRDVTGAVSWEQPGASSLCPLLDDDGLFYDGIDDRHNASAGLVGIFAGSTWTIAVGVVDMVAGATRVYWGVTDGSTANLLNLITSTSRLSVIQGVSANIFTSSAPASTTSMWVTRDGSDYTRRLAGVENGGNTALYPIGLTLLTLGARRSPAASIFFQGKIAWVALSGRALNTTERADIATLLTTNGYPI